MWTILDHYGMEATIGCWTCKLRNRPDQELRRSFTATCTQRNAGLRSSTSPVVLRPCRKIRLGGIRQSGRSRTRHNQGPFFISYHWSSRCLPGSIHPNSTSYPEHDCKYDRCLCKTAAQHWGLRRNFQHVSTCIETPLKEVLASHVQTYQIFMVLDLQILKHGDSRKINTTRKSEMDESWDVNMHPSECFADKPNTTV